jgi:hypothetical protein
MHVPVKAQRRPRPAVGLHALHEHTAIFSVVEALHSTPKIRHALPVAFWGLLDFVVTCFVSPAASCLGQNIFRPMLEFCKTVLKRVSFDRQLFARELTKSFSWLPHDEALALKSWALATYSSKHTQLILTAFATAQALKG